MESRHLGGDVRSGASAPYFTGISTTPTSVCLSAAWPPSLFPAGGWLDVLAAHDLGTSLWETVGTVPIAPAETNVDVEVLSADLPDGTNSRAFFLLDARPVYDPAVCDTDGDGLADEDEAGKISVLPSFEWHDTAAFSTAYGLPPYIGGGIETYNGARLLTYFPAGVTVGGVPCGWAMAFENCFVSLVEPDVPTVWVFPERIFPLNVAGFNSGTILVAPYWGFGYVQYGNTNSYLRAGTLDDGTTVIEFHDVKRDLWSDDGMTCQVIVPGGTGDVIRVSYLSSDVWIDGSHGAAGVHNRRRVLPDGTVYCLAWDFAERGPILPGTTVEYRLGTGTDPDSADSDGDRLDDATELYELGTDPWKQDTDGDGMGDGDELALGTDPLLADTDGDGMPDAWEVANGLDPTSATGDDGASGDPDEDGLSNAQERQLGTDPQIADTDGDGVSDGAEVQSGTGPLVPDVDTDNDGILDWREWELGTDAYAADTDGDGIADGIELALGTAPLNRNTDGDGLDDGVETTLGTDPRQPDSDGDGMPDGWEQQHGFDPTIHSDNTMRTDDDAGADPDGDGVTNAQEAEWGTSPSPLDLDDDGKPDGRDSDGDGVDDGVEIEQLSDPGDASDDGMANSCVAVSFYFGDPSGSSSEKYCLHLRPVGVDGSPRAYHLVNSYYGTCETKTANLRRGCTYEVTLTHAGSNQSVPDYDYTLSCAPPEGVTLEDPDGLFVIADYTSSYFTADGKMATLTVDPLASEPTGTLGVSVVVDKDTILFEDAYTNAPGEVVARKSTWTRVCVDFSAGASEASGTFWVTQGGERIRLHATTRSGAVVDGPQAVEIPAMGVRRLVFYAEGVKASSALNDVTLLAEIAGDGNTASDSKSLTVGRVKLEAVSEFPTNRTRHVFGPLEEANLSIVPQPLFVSTTMTGTIPYNGELTRTSTNCFMRVSNRRKNFHVTVKYSNVELPLSFSVIEPNRKLRVGRHGALAPEMWGNRYARLRIPAVGEIGAALLVETYLEPSFVSFHCLNVEEGFAPATNIYGCFTNVLPQKLSHDDNAGAGRWSRVESNNQIGFDCAAYLDDFNLPYGEAGGFSWNIPMVWYTYDLLMTNSLNAVSQKFNLRNNGDMTVFKHGCWARRSIDNTVFPNVVQLPDEE